MSREYVKRYSPALQREMEVLIHGHGGQPCLVFPCQNGRYYDFENFGTLADCEPYLKEGRLRLYCVDSIDEETWSAERLPPYDRIRRHEAWFRYLTDEIHPFMMAHSGWQGRGMTLGFSMGAYHAANALFRRPDLFDSVIALSGVYDPEIFMGGYMDELLYLNSPLRSIQGMPEDHPYIAALNSCRIILCTGQGAWEDLMVASTGRMEKALSDKGIHAWVDYWGRDAGHDWPWWKKQLRYFLSALFE